MNDRIKNIIAFLIAYGWTFTTAAQPVDSTKRACVEKSSFGIQAGAIGIWAYHEWGLSRQLVLRSELGVFGEALLIDTKYQYISWGFLTDWGFLTGVTVEPKWYYNLDKRMRQSKAVTGNSGNSISVQLGYLPYIIGHSFIQMKPSELPLFILPLWGIRRNIKERFNYEIGLGVKYYLFPNSHIIRTYNSKAHLHLRLRIGYRFSKGTRHKKEK